MWPLILQNLQIVILESLHSFSGCDSVSSFKGKGKKAAWNLLKKHPQFISTFADLGQSWTLPLHTEKELEKFVCLMYGCPLDDVNKARLALFKQKKKGNRNQSSTEPGCLDFAQQESLLPGCHLAIVCSAEHKGTSSSAAWMGYQEKQNPWCDVVNTATFTSQHHKLCAVWLQIRLYWKPVLLPTSGLEMHIHVFMHWVFQSICL